MWSGAHPVRFFANEEGDRSNARWHHTTIATGSCFERRRMRRESAPAHCAGKAKIVEMSRIVLAQTLSKDLSLPGIRWNFKSLKLAQDFEQATLAAELRPRRDVLPARQPAHELRRSRGLDLLA